MHTLILGTFPPHPKRWDYEFYYPNKANRFWKVLAKVGNTELTEWTGVAAVEQRRQLMLKLRVGVQNLGLCIERKNQSALDKDIQILEFQDILGIINEHDTLQRILLSGHSGKSSTYWSFIEYLNRKGIGHTVPKKVRAGNEFTIQCGNRSIHCMIANSTSGAARGVSFEKLVSQFRDAVEF